MAKKTIKSKKIVVKKKKVAVKKGAKTLDPCKKRDMKLMEEYLQIVSDIFLGNRNGFMLISVPAGKGSVRNVSFGHQVSDAFIVEALVAFAEGKIKGK